MHLTLLAFDWVLLLEKAVLILIIISVSLLVAMYETWGERKVAAFMQDRRGPNRAGPGGILQPLAVVPINVLAQRKYRAALRRHWLNAAP